MKKALQYIRDVRAEWFKISWPDRDSVARSVVLILVFSALAAAFVFLVDSAMSMLVGWIF
ncbi:MAG: preprotein translocase subunit SecE [Rickettsiales bacterium]|nr:preprotein translocase subunit SecE [Rickettsiales bacterium]